MFSLKPLYQILRTPPPSMGEHSPSPPMFATPTGRSPGFVKLKRAWNVAPVYLIIENVSQNIAHGCMYELVNFDDLMI